MMCNVKILKELQNKQHFFDFCVLYGNSLNWFSDLAGLQRPIYNCPREKQSELKSIPQYLNVWHWVLLIVIANEILNGNWSHLNWKYNSVGIIGIWGMRAISPSAGLVRTG